jgi:hypothetical protein
LRSVYTFAHSLCSLFRIDSMPLLIRLPAHALP